MKPIWKARFSSESMKAGTRMRDDTSLGLAGCSSLVMSMNSCSSLSCTWENMKSRITATDRSRACCWVMRSAM